MATLNEEIQEAIRKDLPARVGEELRSQLNAGVESAKRVVDLTAQLDRTNAINRELSAANSQWKQTSDQVELKRVELVAREDALKKREDKIAVLEQEVALRKEFNGTLRDVVRDVFSNNRFKYRESYPVTVPGSGNCSGYINQSTREGEGEGTLPGQT